MVEHQVGTGHCPLVPLVPREARAWQLSQEDGVELTSD